MISTSSSIKADSSISSDYQALLSSQDSEGFFKKDFINIFKLDEILKTSGDVLNGINDHETIWATLLAMALLETKYGDKKGEWTMIMKKAKQYLKKNGVS